MYRTHNPSTSVIYQADVKSSSVQRTSLEALDLKIFTGRTSGCWLSWRLGGKRFITSGGDIVSANTQLGFFSTYGLTLTLDFFDDLELVTMRLFPSRS